jgi:hypothetical protein
VQGNVLSLVKADEVVHLQRLPGLAPGLPVLVGIRGRLERRHGDLVGLDVVRVRVAAVLVIGEDHVRAKITNEPDQRGRRLGQRDETEAALGQRRLGVAFRQAGVHETEETLLDPEDLAGPGHLRAPDLGEVGEHFRPVHRRVQDAAALAAGHRGDQDLDAFARVPGHRGGAFARLVVRVRVHCHEAQLRLDPAG